MRGRGGGGSSYLVGGGGSSYLMGGSNPLPALLSYTLLRGQVHTAEECYLSEGEGRGDSSYLVGGGG